MTTPEPAEIRPPERTCIGCRRRKPQSALVRCALGRGGPLAGRNVPGRGAWLCDLECFDKAQQRRAFDRAWRRPIRADELAALRIAFEGVMTNMKDSSAVGIRPEPMVSTKG